MPDPSAHPLVFDRNLLRTRRQRYATQFGAHDFLHRAAAESLLERRADMRHELPRVLALGCPEGMIAAQLRAQGAQLVQADLLPALLPSDGPRVVLDEEWLPFAPGSFDCIISNLALQGVNDLPGTLLQCRQTLAADGVLLAALVGGRTLQELRHCFYQAEQERMGGVSPRIAPNIAADSAAGLLQRAGFTMPVVDSEMIEVGYPDPFALLRDLRVIWGGNVLHDRWRRGTPRGLFVRMAELYSQYYPAETVGIRASFEIIYLHGWTPPG